MVLMAAEDAELLTSLYEGPLEQKSWSTFLARLAQRTHAEYAYIHLLRGGAPITDATGFFYTGRRPNRRMRERYAVDLHRLDPMPHKQMQPHRVYVFEDLLEPGNPDHQRFRDEFMTPVGMNHSLMIRVVEPTGGNAWLMISRSHRDFSEDDAALVAALAPHIAIALRCYTTIGRGKLRASLSEDVAQRLNFGWMTLDVKGHLIEHDRVAGDMLERGDGISRSPAGRLLLPRGQRDAEHDLAHMLRIFAAKPDEKPRSIHVSDEPWLDMVLMPIGDRAVLGAGEKPVSVAYVHGEESSTADRCDHLRHLFGLSRHEAALALSLSRGRSIAESAIDLGLTLETTRSYSKRIFAKTGARGQADLVRLILASVVALI